VTGTEGPDVIVASGISTVDAVGGDDLVCLEKGSVALGASEQSPVAKVNAGPGCSKVHHTAALEAPARAATRYSGRT
jgi:hypothetical protein